MFLDVADYPKVNLKRIGDKKFSTKIEKNSKAIVHGFLRFSTKIFLFPIQLKTGLDMFLDVADYPKVNLNRIGDKKFSTKIEKNSKAIVHGFCSILGRKL